MLLLESSSEPAVIAPPLSEREAHQIDQSSSLSERERESSHAKRVGELREEKEGCENECEKTSQSANALKFPRPANFFFNSCLFGFFTQLL